MAWGETVPQGQIGFNCFLGTLEHPVPKDYSSIERIAEKIRR